MLIDALAAMFPSASGSMQTLLRTGVIWMQICLVGRREFTYFDFRLMS